MAHACQLRRSATKAGMAGTALATIVSTIALLTAPGFAQDNPDLSELPAGPPEETTEGEEGEDTGSGGPLLDLGFETDEEGNLILETDTTEADLTVDPTPIPETGIAGTGDPEADIGADPVADDGELEPAAAGSDSGNTMLLVFAIVGGALVLAAAGVFIVRMRKQRKEELAVVEDVIDPLANERLAGEFVEPEYAGATDAGAYEEGGAAYAQYTEPSYSASAVSSESNAPVNKLDQIRASMVDLADKGLQDSGQAFVVAKKLESAGSKMRPGEWLVMTIAGTVAALFGGAFLFGWLLGAFAAALTAGAFWMYLSVRESTRQKAFAEALPETLQLVAGSLRGGLSMMQAIQTVADEADDPTAEEFQRIVTETRLGRDLAVSFRDLSRRMGSKDFEWVVTAIEIHREVGGDLAGILDRVGDTIRARNRVRGQVKALSAEGKMSGLILFVLPPGMVAAISFLNRAYLNEMLDTTEGQVMLIISGVLLIIGGFWLKRLSRFVY